MKQARTFKSPVPLKRWCYLEKDREGKLPIDDSKSPCDDPVVDIQAARNIRDSWAACFGIDTTRPVSESSGTTGGAP